MGSPLQRSFVWRAVLTMTRDEVEKLARSLDTIDNRERYRIWMNCGEHDLNSLPLTNSGERYCPTCCGLWKPNGEMLNVPARPHG